MKINGREITIEGNISLDKLLEEQGFNREKTAVMKNGEIIPRADYSKTTVENEDSLEVVSFVGGG